MPIVDPALEFAIPQWGARWANATVRVQCSAEVEGTLFTNSASIRLPDNNIKIFGARSGFCIQHF
jgi:hypothetical protein